MHHLLRVSRGIDRLNYAFGVVAAFCVVAAVLISAVNAFNRYLFSYSSNAWLEIQWYLFGGMIFLGASCALQTNYHVRVDVLYALLSERGQLMVDIFGLLFFLLPGMAFLGWLCWPVFVTAFVSGETSNNFGGLIRWPVLLLFPLGFGLLVLQGIAELIKRIAAWHGDVKLDLHYEQPLQ